MGRHLASLDYGGRKLAATTSILALAAQTLPHGSNRRPSAAERSGDHSAVEDLYEGAPTRVSAS